MEKNVAIFSLEDHTHPAAVAFVPSAHLILLPLRYPALCFSAHLPPHVGTIVFTLFCLTTFSKTMQHTRELILKPSRTLWVSWPWKLFWVPHFLTSPSFQKAGWNSCWWGKRADMETRGGYPRNDSAAREQGPGSTQETQMTIFLSSSAEWKPQQLEDVSYLMKHSSLQREGHSLITLRAREAHPETMWGQIKGVQALHTPQSFPAAPPLNHCCTTPHQVPLDWDTQVLRDKSTVSLFA